MRPLISQLLMLSGVATCPFNVTGSLTTLRVQCANFDPFGLAQAGRTELYFANVLLGHLTFDAARGLPLPTAYIVPARRLIASPSQPPAAAVRAGKEQAPSPAPLPEYCYD